MATPEQILTTLDGALTATKPAVKTRRWSVFTIKQANVEIERLKAENAALKSARVSTPATPPRLAIIPPQQTTARPTPGGIPQAMDDEDRRAWNEHQAITDPIERTNNYRANKDRIDRFHRLHSDEIEQQQRERALAAKQEKRNNARR